MNLKKFRRLLAFVLAVIVAFSATPVTYAAEGEAGESGYETPVDESQEDEDEPGEGAPEEGEPQDGEESTGGGGFGQRRRRRDGGECRR